MATKKKSASKKAAKKSAKKKKAKPAKKLASNTRAAALDRVRRMCLALPETSEVEAWGTPTFRVKGKIFVMASEGSHHNVDRPQAWILSVGVEQDFVLRARPDRYFKPPYVGPSGWIGAWLDKSPPWAEIEELIRDGWRRRAPKKLVAQLDD
jgi:hypothetical protein